MGSTTSNPPIVALASPNGWLGGSLAPILVEYVRRGEFSELRLITTKSNAALAAHGSCLPPGKVKIFETKYDIDSLAQSKALRGVHVLICAAGTNIEAGASQALIEVASTEGVRVYIPSEFGSDYDINTYGNVLYEAKRKHRIAAEKLGLKCVAIATSAFTPALRTPFFGVHDNTWNITGDGNMPYAVTDITDIAHYTCRAALLAYYEPEKVPSRLRVYSDIRTWNDYAAATEKITGQPVDKAYHSQAEVEKRYLSGQESPYFILQLVAPTKLHDFSDCNHNELLNPSQKYFKPSSFEDSLQAELKAAKRD